MTNMQKDLFDAYEQGTHLWLGRVKSEADLWSELAAKLTASRSVPEAIESYQKCVARRMQMAVDDGRQLFDEWGRGRRYRASLTAVDRQYRRYRSNSRLWWPCGRWAGQPNDPFAEVGWQKLL